MEGCLEQTGSVNKGLCTMREDLAARSFLAVTVASLVLLCSGLLAITFS